MAIGDRVADRLRTRWERQVVGGYPADSKTGALTAWRDVRPLVSVATFRCGREQAVAFWVLYPDALYGDCSEHGRESILGLCHEFGDDVWGRL